MVVVLLLAWGLPAVLLGDLGSSAFPSLAALCVHLEELRGAPVAQGWLCDGDLDGVVGGYVRAWVAGCEVLLGVQVFERWL